VELLKQYLQSLDIQTVAIQTQRLQFVKTVQYSFDFIFI